MMLRRFVLVAALGVIVIATAWVTDTVQSTRAAYLEWQWGILRTPRVSPDGRVLAFGLNGKVWRLPRGAPPRVVGQGYVMDTSVSIGGRVLAFVTLRPRSEAAYAVGPAGARLVSLGRGQEIRVSPTGRQVAVYYCGRVRVAASGGGTQGQACAGALTYISQPWALGEQALVLRRDGGLVVWRLGTHATQQLGPCARPQCASVSPDGSRLAVVTYAGSASVLRLVSLPDGQETERRDLPSPVWYCPNLEWRADGTGFAIFVARPPGYENAVLVYDVGSGRLDTWPRLPPDAFLIGWSDTGRLLVGRDRELLAISEDGRWEQLISCDRLSLQDREAFREAVRLFPWPK
jgi:hypothetical protein